MTTRDAAEAVEWECRMLFWLVAKAWRIPEAVQWLSRKIG